MQRALANTIRHIAYSLTPGEYPDMRAKPGHLERNLLRPTRVEVQFVTRSDGTTIRTAAITGRWVDCVTGRVLDAVLEHTVRYRGDSDLWPPLVQDALRQALSNVDSA